jgi:hypothetical protein
MKTIWIGKLPEIFGYGLMVAEETEVKCINALTKAYFDWYGETYKPIRTFDESMEHWGGSIIEVELGKGYFDNFNS